MTNRPTAEQLTEAISSLKLSTKERDLPRLWALIYEIEAQQAEIRQLKLALMSVSNDTSDLIKNHHRYTEQQRILTRQIHCKVTEVLPDDLTKI